MCSRISVWGYVCWSVGPLISSSVGHTQVVQTLLDLLINIFFLLDVLGALEVQWTPNQTSSNRPGNFGHIYLILSYLSTTGSEEYYANLETDVGIVPPVHLHTCLMKYATDMPWQAIVQHSLNKCVHKNHVRELDSEVFGFLLYHMYIKFEELQSATNCFTRGWVTSRKWV